MSAENRPSTRPISDNISNDPIYKHVSWRPCSVGGASVKTQELEFKDTIIRTKTVGLLRYLPIALIAIGIGIAIIGGPVSYAFEGMMAVLIPSFIGVSFIGAGLFIMTTREKFTIDKEKGVFFQGQQYQENKFKYHPKQGKLSEIHAIQLIAENVKIAGSDADSASAFMSYEFNLVLKNGSRINVMDHGDQFEIGKSAELVSQSLGVPVWRSDKVPLN